MRARAAHTRSSDPPSGPPRPDPGARLEPVLQSDLVPADVLIGDVLLLSSDRLTQMLPDQHLKEIAHTQRDIPLLRAKALIQAALDTGGIDNSTVVACWIVDRPDQANIH